MKNRLSVYFLARAVLVFVVFPTLNAFSQASWTTIPTGTQFTIHEVSFPNDSVGYFVCDTVDLNPQGKVYRTQNRGLIWSLINFTSHYLVHIDAPSENTVYASGNNGNYAVLRLSVNGGQTWLNMNVNSPEGPMDFVNDTLGFICSSGGPGNRIWRTGNSGTSFDSVLMGGFPCGMFDLQYVTDSIAYAGGLFGPKLSKTTQQLGGWSDQTNDYAVRAICFLDPDTGYAVAEYTLTSSPIAVIKTTDGGTTWTQLPNSEDPAGNGWTKIHCRNTRECICVGGGGSVASTSDGGLTWNNENSGTMNTLLDVYYGSNFAVAAGENGTVIRRMLIPSGMAETEGEMTLHVYPNPANDLLTLTAAMQEGDKVSVFDISGRTLLREIITGNPSSFSINIARLSEGTYIASLQHKTGIHKVKFAKVGN